MTFLQYYSPNYSWHSSNIIHKIIHGILPLLITKLSMAFFQYYSPNYSWHSSNIIHQIIHGTLPILFTKLFMAFFQCYSPNYSWHSSNIIHQIIHGILPLSFIKHITALSDFSLGLAGFDGLLKWQNMSEHRGWFHTAFDWIETGNYPGSRFLPL